MYFLTYVISSPSLRQTSDRPLSSKIHHIKYLPVGYWIKWNPVHSICANCGLITAFTFLHWKTWMWSSFLRKSEHSPTMKARQVQHPAQFFVFLAVENIFTLSCQGCCSIHPTCGCIMWCTAPAACMQCTQKCLIQGLCVHIHNT